MTAEPVWGTSAREQGAAASRTAPSFDALYRAHYARLHRFLLGMTRRDPLAEDIAQETLLRAFLHYEDLDPDRSPWPWLKKVATRLVYDHARAQRNVEVGPVPDRVSPDTAASSADRQLVSQMLDGLPARQRAAVTLRYLDDWKSAEIAAVLDLPRPAVEQLLLRARRSLKIEYRRLSGDRLRLLLWPLAAWGQRMRQRAARGMGRVADAGLPSLASTAESMSALVVAGALVVGAVGGAPPSGSSMNSAGHGEIRRAEAAWHSKRVVSQDPGTAVGKHRASAHASRTRIGSSTADTVSPTETQQAVRVNTGALGTDGGRPIASASTGRDEDKVKARGVVQPPADDFTPGEAFVNIPCDSGSVTSEALCGVYDAATPALPDAP